MAWTSRYPWVARAAPASDEKGRPIYDSYGYRWPAAWTWVKEPQHVGGSLDPLEKAFSTRRDCVAWCDEQNALLSQDPVAAGFALAAAAGRTHAEMVANVRTNLGHRCAGLREALKRRNWEKSWGRKISAADRTRCSVRGQVRSVRLLRRALAVLEAGA